MQSFIINNFFYSANSETYQDAFISWVIYNYNSMEDEELGAFSRYFIDRMLNDFQAETKLKIDRTKPLKLERQQFDADIIIIVETENHEEHLIIIEDKVGSAIHASNKKKSDEKYETQLIKYFECFQENSRYSQYFLEGKVHLFVYKNQFLDATENEQIRISNEKISDYCNKQGRRGWIGLDISAIYEIFAGFLKEQGSEHFDNLILGSYFSMLAVWKHEYDAFEKEKKVKATLENIEYFWNERSWLWEVFFYELVEKIFGSRDVIMTEKAGKSGAAEIAGNSKVSRRVKIEPGSNGYYWCMSIYSKSKRYSVHIHARDFCAAIDKSVAKKCNLKISISINLTSKKYKDEYEWKIGERKECYEKIGNIMKSKSIANGKCSLKPTSKINYKEPKDEKSRVSNKIGFYTYDISELSVEELSKAVMEVMEFAEKWFEE